jgi:hypothetical protein
VPTRAQRVLLLRQAQAEQNRRLGNN